MQASVVVHKTQEDMDAWLKKISVRQKETPVEYGAKLYSLRNCKGCHSIDGSKLVGPSYKDSFGTERALADGSKVAVDENYVRESILEPKAKVAAGYQPVMPSYKGQLSDDDIYCLTEYIKSLSSNTPKSAADKQGKASDDADAASDEEKPAEDENEEEKSSEKSAEEKPAE